MHKLYIKTHNKTGLKYFGYSSLTGKKFEQYKGSGLRWKRHLAKHGTDITTEIVYRSEYVTEEMIDFAKRFSEINSIVVDENWANLMDETCEVGLAKGFKHSCETRLKMSESAKGKKRPKSKELIEHMKEHRLGEGNPMFGRNHSEESKQKISESNKGKIISKGHRDKISKSHLEMDEIQCPHCGTCGKLSIMKRWHFDNCSCVKKRKTRTCPHCGKTGSNNMDRYHFENCKFK